MPKARKRSGAGTSQARRATAWGVLGAFLGTLPGAPAAIAAPQGERVVKGKATFERDGANTHITTGTKETIVDYDRFDVGSGESVRIDQPTSRSRILNRVPRGDESRIDGSLSSNGIVYILNPAGVFLGNHAVVDVGGLVAGAGSLSNKDFMRGVDRITGVQGDVGVAEGAQVQATRDVLLVGRHVENLGEIASERGMIAIVAGRSVMLTRHGSHLLLDVDAPEEPADGQFALTQAGTLEAQHVTLSAGDSYSLAMNHTGITRAGEIEAHAGRAGEVQLAGTMDASNTAPGQKGGSIHVEGGKIDVQGATLDASGAAGGGEILVGGDLHGGGTLETAREVEVGAGSTLRADATSAGDGGKIIVYADEQTRFYGAVSARGGPQGGDGGFAEISAKKLVAAGRVDLGAAQGEAGTVLYDPDKVVICGGSGTICGVSDADSEIFESSLESNTDANVVIQATNRIETAGLFTNDVAGEGPGVVVIMPGHSLTLQTTGTSVPQGATSNDLGIDLTKSDDPNGLTWRVSQGGNITLQTGLATIDQLPAPVDPDHPENSAPPMASIKVDRIESNGAAFQSVENTQLQPGGAHVTASVDLPKNRSITLTAKRGDIEVRQIAATGENATPAPPDDNDPSTIEKGRSASAGAQITITSAQGNLTIGNGADPYAIQAYGGSGTPDAHSPGANGATVTIGTEGGKLDVLGAIDVHGGDGFGSFTLTNNSTGQSSDLSGGGAGGAIGLAATGEDTRYFQGELSVKADLDVHGGNGHAVTETGGTVLVSSGGLGGAIALSAQDTITVGAPGARAHFDASGGDGTASGGSARGGLTELTGDVPSPSFTESFRFTGPVGDNGVLARTNGDVKIDAEMTARGGQARADLGDGIPLSTLTGGAGGRGGDANVIAQSLTANDMRLDLSGGDGNFASVRGGVDPPRDSSGNVFAIGGNGGTLAVGTVGAIDLGGTASSSEPSGVIARGGQAINGNGGEGGIATINGGDSVAANGFDSGHIITLGDIDVAGGSASLENDSASHVPVAGGKAGSVTADAAEKDVGRVLLRGRVGGDGGTGVDADKKVTHAPGATVSLTAASAIQVANDVAPGGVAPDSVLVSGGNLTLDASEIGPQDDGSPLGHPTALVPIPIAGTAVTVAGATVTGDEGTDLATVNADGRLAVELRGGAAEGLETLQVVMREATGSAQVTRDDGGSDVEVLRSEAATAGTPHTLEKLQTNDQDPFVGYRLNVAIDTTATPAQTQPDLAIARGAIDVGVRGALIANGSPAPDSTTGVAGNRGRIIGLGLPGDGPHATSAAGLRFEGTSIGTQAVPIEVAAATHAQPGVTDPVRPILRFDANGEVDAKVESGTPFSGIEIGQFDADAASRVAMDAGDGIQIDPAGSPDGRAPVSRITSAVTTASGSGFSYRLQSKAPDSSVKDAVLRVDRVDLGGTGLLTAPGDVVLSDPGAGPPTIQTHGNSLSISTTLGGIQQESASAVSIDMSGGAGTQRDLVLIAAGDIGTLATSGNNATSQNPIRTQGVERLAGQASSGDFVLVNSGTPSDVGLRIQKLTPQDPALQDPGSQGVQVSGVLAGDPNSGPGSIDLENVGSRIVLGNVSDGVEFAAPQLQATDDVSLKAPSIEIENARYLKVATPIVGPVFVPLNDARIVAGKDVVLDGPVQTSAGSFASSTDPDAPAPAFVNGKLRIESKGTTHFTGDVGGDGSNEKNELALLDTTAAVAEGAGVRTFRVGDAHFRGTLDGPAGVQIDAQTGATFDGNIGGGTPLASLDVQAEQLRFTTANQIVATGNITLDGNPGATTVPPAATIADTTGGLNIRTNGIFSTAPNNKLSVQGPLEITAAQVSVEDVNAAQHLQIDSPDINIRARKSGEVLLRNGQTTTDGGTDIVADSISFSSLPKIDTNTFVGPVLLGVGSGGVSAPGNLSEFEVKRFTQGADPVRPGDMTGPNGVVLDLTAGGRTIVGNPSEDVPRERPLTDPSLPPRFSKQQPGPAPVVDAGQVLAYLRCGDAGGVGAGCDDADAEQLAGVQDWQDSALATPRADQLAQSYRALRAHKLSVVFDQAGAGFRKEQGFGEFDSAAFARYLESGAQPVARTAIHQLANLLVEVDLLGLAPADEARVRHELASQLAAEADLDGFDTDAVLQAVAATSIELPQQAANAARR
jgi:filamentous hemagglutinin family protein